MIETCPKCGRRFRNPDTQVVTQAFVDGQYVTECPICYAKDFRRIHGIRWNPRGEIASWMFSEAKRTLIRSK